MSLPHGSSPWPFPMAPSHGMVTLYQASGPSTAPNLQSAHSPALLPDSISQSSLLPPSTPRPHELPSSLSFTSVQGLCWCIVSSLQCSLSPAQRRHTVNTSSSLSADLVSENNRNYELLSPHSLEEGITVCPTALQISTGQNRGPESRIEVWPHFWTLP